MWLYTLHKFEMIEVGSLFYFHCVLYHQAPHTMHPFLFGGICCCCHHNHPTDIKSSSSRYKPSPYKRNLFRSFSLFAFTLRWLTAHGYGLPCMWLFQFGICHCCAKCKVVNGRCKIVVATKTLAAKQFLSQ